MNKKMIAPIAVAILVVVYYIGYAVLLMAIPDLHIIVKILLVLIPIVMSGYMIWAAKERIEEIKGGEEDDLSQY